MKKIITGITLLITTLSNSQNVTSIQNLTSGGYGAGTTGSYSTYYGTNAGFASQSNSGYNTFIGNDAGQSNISGEANTFVGMASGYGNTTGTRNAYFGFWSGGENNGSDNTCIGYGAGGESSSGSGNVLIGTNVGFGAEHNNKLIIGNGENSQLIFGDFVANQLKLNAKVGVGYGFSNYPTTAGSVNVSNYNLFVKGGILTEEVRVSLQNTWADYVFSKDYKLPTLNEVEKHIIEKGHLINVPSAKEVKENGIEMGEMFKIQQEKIEELTLYAIEQNKINEKQKQEIEELKAQMKQLLEKN